VVEHDRVDRSRRRAGNAFDPDAAVVEQLIEHPPGESAVGAAALQRQIDRLGAALARARGRLATPARRARRERVGNEICKQNGEHSRMSMSGAPRRIRIRTMWGRYCCIAISNYGSAARGKKVQKGESPCMSNSKPSRAPSIRPPAVFPHPDHDHDRCSSDAMVVAEALCAQRGQRLTPIRRKVLAALLASHKPLGAYEIMD